MEFRPIVLACEPERELRWRGRLLVPGVFDGEHAFSIEPLSGGRVRFVHRERFSGVLVLLVWHRLDRDTRLGFEAMNAALKARAEARRVSRPGKSGGPPVSGEARPSGRR